MQWPLVSIIIATYNRYETLLNALESIDYPNCEVIVVDDGSDPPVKDTLDLAPFPNVELITKVNGGVSSARNVATKRVKGRYVAHLDSDDVFVPGKLQRLVSVLEQCPDVDFAFHDIGRFTYEGQRRRSLPELHSDFYPGAKKACTSSRLTEVDNRAYRIPSVEAFKLLTSGTAIFPSSMIMRLSLMNKLEPWDETLKNCNDMEYFARALCHTDAVYIDAVLTHMGVGDDNLSKNQLAQLVSDVQILTRMKERSLSLSHQKALTKSIKQRSAALAWHYRRSGEPLKAKAAYQQSLMHGFSAKCLLWLCVCALNVARSG